MVQSAESQYPLYRRSFGLQDLVDRYPPRLTNVNKRIVYNLACPPSAVHQGEVIVSRWPPAPLPATFSWNKQKTSVIPKTGFFIYETPPSQQLDWHLNFAHSDLFCAYGGPLFAQDEMQVAEHPACGSLRQALLANDCLPATFGPDGPTPILIQGIERRCSIATDPNPEQGRPRGLYGNEFARARPDAILQAVTVLTPPTRSNLIAIEAPSGQFGAYSRADIHYILVTAYTGFHAACQEGSVQGPELKTAIHTGYWGCGAYGGNRQLMSILQIIAATLAGVDILFFHTGDESESFEQALLTLRELAPSNTTIDTEQIIQDILQRGYEWGASDGN